MVHFSQGFLTKILFSYGSLVVTRSVFMNKLVVVLSITIVILGIVSGFLFYQLNAIQSLNNELRNQNAEIQNQISEQETQLSKYTNLVKITEFTIEPGFNPYIGLTLHNSANVTIENLGVNDVEGLTLTIEHSSPSVGKPYSLEVLRSGEKREITGDLFSVVGTTGWVTVTLKLGDIIVDEYIIPRFPNTQ